MILKSGSYHEVQKMIDDNISLLNRKGSYTRGDLSLKISPLFLALFELVDNFQNYSLRKNIIKVIDVLLNIDKTNVSIFGKNIRYRTRTR